MNHPAATVDPGATGLGLILASGADARTFLQGQLSADLLSLTAGEVRLAACNSPQGRVQALPWIVVRDEAVGLIVPGSLMDSTLLRLRKYLLRAKVQLQPAPATLSVQMIDANTVPVVTDLAAAEHRQIGDVSYLRLPGLDALLRIGNPVNQDLVDDTDLRWVRAGLPQVYPATHEAFIAQMLNVDLLGGISFDKGCYTGQEIIARAHYRGTVKRRMFRFRAACPPPPPGTRILTGEQHAGDVVSAAAADTGCELLAVISLAQLDKPLQMDGLEHSPLERLTLPYEVPS